MLGAGQFPEDKGTYATPIPEIGVRPLYGVPVTLVEVPVCRPFDRPERDPVDPRSGNTVTPVSIQDLCSLVFSLAGSLTLRCHDANGEVYTLGLSRSRVTLSSYEDDAIRTAVETWADSVPALA